MEAENRDRVDKCIFSAMKKRINRRQRTFRFSVSVDELTSGRPCFVGWICSLKCFPSPFFPPPLSLKPDAALCLAGARWVRGSARLHPAGEAAAAAAAETSLHNGAPGRGRGGACSEDGSRNGGSMGGTKERLSGWKGHGDVCLIFTPCHQNLSLIPEQY